jgi:hypothetical protein
MDLYFLSSILVVDIFISLFAIFIGLLKEFSTYVIGIVFLAYY